MAEARLVDIGNGHWVYKDTERDRLFYCPKCINGGDMQVLQVNISTMQNGGSRHVSMTCLQCKTVWSGVDPHRIGLL